MERKKYLLTIVALWFAFLMSNASNQVRIYEAFVNDRMDLWEKVLKEMESSDNNNPYFLLELINYQYGFTGWCIDNKKYSLASSYVKKAEQNIKILEKKNFELSSTYAYKAAFYGFRIGINVYEAPFIGPRSIENARKSINLDGNNPLGYIQYANSQYYMPAVFGGSKTIALEYYNKALVLMEKNKNLTEKNWNYLNLLIILVKVYEETGNLQNARSIYHKVLQIEPNIRWFINEYNPRLFKK